jgi:ribosomal protein S2
VKINKTNIKKTNFLKLKLLKNYIYINKTIEILPRLKKALNVIFKYHINNKRILFIGNSNQKLITALTQTKHIFIPQSIWVEGILTNSESFFKQFLEKSNKTSRQKFNAFEQLNKTIDLIVIINEHFSNKIIDEANKAQIPTIVCNCELEMFNTKPCFKIPNNDKKLTNNFLYSILVAIIYKISKIKLKNKIKNYRYF